MPPAVKTRRRGLVEGDEPHVKGWQEVNDFFEVVLPEPAGVSPGLPDLLGVRWWRCHCPKATQREPLPGWEGWVQPPRRLRSHQRSGFLDETAPFGDHPSSALANIATAATAMIAAIHPHCAGWRVPERPECDQRLLVRSPMECHGGAHDAAPPSYPGRRAPALRSTSASSRARARVAARGRAAERHPTPTRSRNLA